jgi:hypothetical protein
MKEYVMKKSIRAFAIFIAVTGLIACSKKKDAPADAAANGGDVKPKCEAGSASATATATATGGTQPVYSNGIVIGQSGGTKPVYSNGIIIGQSEDSRRVSLSVSLPNKNDCGVSVYSINLDEEALASIDPKQMNKDGVLDKDVLVNTLGTDNQVYMISQFQPDQKVPFEGAVAYLFTIDKDGGLVLSDKVALSKAMSPYIIKNLILEKAKESSVLGVVQSKSWNAGTKTPF